MLFSLPLKSSASSSASKHSRCVFRPSFYLVVAFMILFALHSDAFVSADGALEKIAKGTESLMKKVFVKYWYVWVGVAIGAGGAYYYVNQSAQDQGALKGTTPNAATGAAVTAGQPPQQARAPGKWW